MEGFFNILGWASIVLILVFLFKGIGKGLNTLGKSEDDPNWYKNGVCLGQLERLRTMYEMKMMGTRCMSPHNHIDTMTMTDTYFKLTISNSKLNESRTLFAGNTGEFDNQVKEIFEQWKEKEKLL